jgi:hypothetical protein
MATAYSDLIEAELRAELDRKAAMDARAASLATISGGVAVLLAAVGTLAGGVQTSPPPWYAITLLVLALLAFSWASFAGVLGGRLMPYEVAKVVDMEQMIFVRWRDDDDLAQRAVADLRKRMIVKLRLVNKKKVWWLQAGWLGQAAAVLLLTAVVAIVLATGGTDPKGETPPDGTAPAGNARPTQ